MNMEAYGNNDQLVNMEQFPKLPHTAKPVSEKKQ